MSEKDLQEKIFQFQVLEDKFKELNQKRELFTIKLAELEQTKQAIDDIAGSNDDEILIPLGSGVFVPGKLEKKEKMIVSLGENAAMEKDVEEIKSILEKRRKILEEGIESVKKSMLNIAQEMQAIQVEAQELLHKEEEKAG